MRNRLVILLALLGSTSGGCASEGTERVAPAAAASRPGEAAPSTPDPVVPQEGALGAPAPGTAPGTAPADDTAPGALPGATGAVRNTRTLEEVGVAIEAAIAAAAAVPEAGEDMCGIAYRGLNTMLIELRRRMPEQPANPLPPRDGFMEICRDMPPEVQQCLVIAYAVEHQEECERASATLDPAMRARIEALMGRPAQPAP